jgi:hypothetical protein
MMTANTDGNLYYLVSLLVNFDKPDKRQINARQIKQNVNLIENTHKSSGSDQEIRQFCWLNSFIPFSPF